MSEAGSDGGSGAAGGSARRRPLFYGWYIVGAGLGIQALIGRDILANCVLVYNGNMNQFTLAF